MSQRLNLSTTDLVARNTPRNPLGLRQFPEARERINTIIHMDHNGNMDNFVKAVAEFSAVSALAVEEFLKSDASPFPPPPSRVPYTRAVMAIGDYLEDRAHKKHQQPETVALELLFPHPDKKAETAEKPTETPSATEKPRRAPVPRSKLNEDALENIRAAMTLWNVDARGLLKKIPARLANEIRPKNFIDLVEGRTGDVLEIDGKKMQPTIEMHAIQNLLTRYEQQKRQMENDARWLTEPLRPQSTNKRAVPPITPKTPENG